jgi:hypothetical protein
MAIEPPDPSTLLDADDLTAIDFKIAQMSPVEKVQARSELRVRGLAAVTGIKIPDRIVPIAGAVEMFALYENTSAAEAYQIILEGLRSGDLSLEPE